jgi:hypothetical protein
MTRFLLFAAALLLAGQAQAYVILESKYRVEVKPGLFEDHLVLKCDNGRKITVSWEARLSEACGEVDIPRTGAAAAQDEAQERQAGQDRQSSQERQKEIMMSRVREQYGNVDERHVTIPSGVAGAEPHFSPQMREILKRYELCRKNTKNNPTCAAERHQAMAALSAQPAASEFAAGASAAGEPQPAPKAKPAAKHKQAAAKPAAKSDPAPSDQADAGAPKPEPEVPHAAATPAGPAPAHANPEPQAANATMPVAPASTPEPTSMPDRATREQKIAADYALCMRAKPKFECESARSAALKALDTPAKPKTKGKSTVKAPQQPDVVAN